MGLFDGIIIVSDIDGTFLGRQGRLVPENLERIRRFQRGGGRFTIATGREYFIVYPSVPQVEEICNCPAIACNGAYIYDYHAHEKLVETFLEDGPLLPVIRAVGDACPRAGFRVDMLDCYFVERIYKEFEWVRDLYPDKARVMPLEEMPRGCWHKVAFDGPPDEIDRAEAMLRARLDARYNCIRSGADIAEIQSAAATKGKMLARLKELSGGRVLYAIGDYDNDYDMLVSADRCAVPANGLDKLKVIPGAIQVCDHDEGAIADLIDHIEKELRS
ncbi:MAG: HAD hydrolase family protein [Clostridia bacterium]|nr:HAD hydrolase family protein [Clostridia bacterium]